MPITITIEDGTSVADANSYISVSEAKAMVLELGTDISATEDDDVARILIQSFRYLESREPDFSGEVVSSSQPSAWPRKEALRKCRIEIAEDEIPQELKDAQAFLVLKITGGLSLFRDPVSGSAASTFTSERTLGPLSIKTKAFPVGSAGDDISGGEQTNPLRIPELESLLEPIFNSGSNSSEFCTVRV